MRRRLWSVHVQPKDAAGHDFRVVEDRFRPLALILPFLWAFFEGLWIMGTLLLAALVLLPVVLPPGGGLVAWYGIMLIAGLEGGSLIRLELRFRGWRERGLVEAASRESADECWLTGKAVRV